jgi:hypothetical protein
MAQEEENWRGALIVLENILDDHEEANYLLRMALVSAMNAGVEMTVEKAMEGNAAGQAPAAGAVAEQRLMAERRMVGRVAKELVPWSHKGGGDAERPHVEAQKTVGDFVRTRNSSYVQLSARARRQLSIDNVNRTNFSCYLKARIVDWRVAGMDRRARGEYMEYNDARNYLPELALLEDRLEELERGDEED